MGTRTITGTVHHLDGTDWASGTIQFELLEAFETATETYPKETHTETLDANGAFSITLGVPDSGTAKYKITLPDHKRYTVYIASGAATTLESLLTIAGSAVAQDAVQTLIDANNVLTMVSTTGTYTVLASDDLVRCNGTFTVTLPAASGSGAMYCIKNVGTGVITLDGNAAETIDGAATQTISSLGWMTVVDAASGAWDIL